MQIEEFKHETNRLINEHIETAQNPPLWISSINNHGNFLYLMVWDIRNTPIRPICANVAITRSALQNYSLLRHTMEAIDANLNLALVLRDLAGNTLISEKFSLHLVCLSSTLNRMLMDSGVIDTTDGEVLFSGHTMRKIFNKIPWNVINNNSTMTEWNNIYIIPKREERATHKQNVEKLGLEFFSEEYLRKIIELQYQYSRSVKEFEFSEKIYTSVFTFNRLLFARTLGQSVDLAAENEELLQVRKYLSKCHRCANPLTLFSPGCARN